MNVCHLRYKCILPSSSLTYPKLLDIDNIDVNLISQCNMPICVKVSCTDGQKTISNLLELLDSQI